MSDQQSDKLEEAQHDLLLIIFTALTILFSTGLAKETTTQEPIIIG
ncbi:hypothetical protein [Desulfoscipio sp. XC116]